MLPPRRAWSERGSPDAGRPATTLAKVAAREGDGDSDARPGGRLRRLRLRAQRAYERVPLIPRIVDELARVELLDRALALGAQALLALIPLLMVVGAFLPSSWGRELTSQVRDVIGVDDEAVEPLQTAASSVGSVMADVSLFTLLVALASASSYARALGRMYAKVWDEPPNRGLSAFRRSVVWIAGWVVTLQTLAIVLRALADVPLSGVVHLALQLGFNVFLWWWTAHLLLRGRFGWLVLLPTAVISAVLVVVLSAASRLVMPRYTRLNLDQFGPLGVVFAIASWLVVFGGVLVLSAVVGRHLVDGKVRD